ncbi:HAD family phosphatase [Staphylococcus aureus]|uniref:HAD family hydrolase n=1 Tax=Staphylococcus aureus TaxID=1280 RepID=UPI0019098620|nr:HAD family hydrolase [Staphylococcus aureus]MBK4005723.1 HAD family phosphatase [Staphylococcus aureus]
MDNVKAIFLDMDGTILHENNQASPYTKDVINRLREKGYKVFLATGRSHSEIHQLVPQDFAVNGIISSNGTIGEVDGEIIFKHGLSLAQVQQITNLTKRQQIYYEVFPFEGNRVSLKEDETWMRDMIRSQDPINGVSHSEWSSRQDALAGKIDWVTKFPEGEYSKIYLFSSNLEKITAFRDELKQNHVQLQISVSNSSRFNAETMAYQTDKGTGIKEMIAHFGIHQEETLVIGDSDNDRAMFEFGHYTVAMKNARPEIQALTSDVTAYTNEEDGAAKYLAKHFLAD